MISTSKNSFSTVTKRLIALLMLILAAPVLKTYANCGNINSAFTPSQTLVCGPGATVISFTNTSTGAGAAGAGYDWYRNGVFFSTTTGLAVPGTSTISAVGTYTYLLVAYDTALNCRDSATVQVIIRPLPVAAFNFAPNNQCAGTTISFTNTSTGTGAFTTYAWNFGDAGTSTLTSPNHVYAAGGTYNATLTITNGTGCTSTITHAVTVLPRPVATISGDDGDGDTQYCLTPVDNTTTDPVTFFNLSTGAVSYTWDLGDGTAPFTTASTASFGHTYTSYGTFPVTMTATGANGCTTTTTLSVIFDKFVSASFIVPLAQFSGCVPHTVTPNNASQNASQYVWNFGDGTPPVTTTSFVAPSHTYQIGGSYTISLVASNSCNSSTSTVGPITVVGPPVIAFTATPALGCAPQSVTFGNTTTGASPTNNFYWDFGNGNTLNGVKFPPAQIYHQGTWTIMMVSGNACGTDTVFHTIVVDTIPTAAMTANPLVGCTPLVVSTTNTSTGGNLSYQWFIDGVFTYTTATIPNQTFTAPVGNAAVTHSIHLHVFNHCGADDTTLTITVHPLVQAILAPPTSTICAGSSVTFTQTSKGDALTYAWNFGNGNTSTAAAPPAQTYATAGTYTVTLTVTGFCGVSTTTGTVTVNPIPVAPTAAPATICSGTSTTLTATAPGPVYQWYNAAAAGTLLQTGASYATPVLVGTTTYYVQSTALGCTSPRTPVTVTVNPIPVAPTVPGTTICSGNTATLTASAPGGTYDWYNAAAGGTLLNTGASYTTPVLIATTTYYVQATILGCTGPRTAVTVTVTPIPAAPTAAPASICSGTTATLTATAPGGTYQWYDATVAGTLLQTGASYTTPVLTATTTYYVQTTVSGCTSPRTPVTVTVKPIPVADIVPDVIAGCSGLVVHFNNNSTLGGTYAWNFAGATPSTSAVYSPPAITFNTSGNNLVYITVNVAGCIQRDSAFISIAPLPIPAFTATPNSGCSPVTTIINNTSTVTAGDTYAWNFNNGTTSTAASPPSQTYYNSSTSIDSIFTIKLVISAANGCRDSVSHPVTVHPNPIAAFTVTDDTICANTLITFLNGSAGASTYQWTFGDATTSTAINPAHTYTVPNNYTSQLIISTAFGCKDTIQKLIVVDSVPVAAFSASTECLGFATVFTNTSTGSIVSWNWNFGDGSPAGTTPAPTHMYPSNGTYNVTLTVTNAFGCSKSVTHSVIVNAVPIAGFNNSTACLGTASTFTDQTTGTPISWTWDFGDATALNHLQNPTHTYAAAGSYNVTLIAFGGSGCSDTISHSVTVNPVPTSNFTFASVCTNDTMFFNSTSLGAPTTFVWNFGDGVTNSTNNPSPTHVYSTAGTYNVVLTVGYATGCTNSITKPVTAFPLTVPNFTKTTPCLNVTTVFTDATTNTPTQWTWNFGDGSALSSTHNPTHTYAAPGTYPVTLVTQNVFGCKDSITINAIVNPLPVAAFKFDTVCKGTATSFTNQSVSSVSWSWNFGDGTPVNTANSPTHIYAASGTYVVSLISANVFGCTDTISHSIIVNPNPVAAYTATTACFSYTTTFTDNSTSAISWSWNYGDGSALVATASPSYIYPAAGTYNAALTVTNIFGCTNTVTHPVLVNAVPIAAFINTTVCKGQATAFTDQTSGTPIGWTWDFGDVTAAGTTQNPSHTYAAAGTYLVTLIASGGSGCQDTISNSITVNPVPTANFTFASVCTNDTMFFNSTSLGTPNTFNWNFGDGFADNSNNPSPTHVYATAGTYNVTLTAGYSVTGCTNSITIPVTAFPLTVPNFTSTTPCLNVGTAFTDATTNAPTQWTWNFGDGTAFSATQNPVHTYSAPGTYPVTLLTQNIFGCKDSVTINTVVNPLPVAAFSFDTVCANAATSFTVQSTSAVSWTWNFGDASALSTSNSPVHIYPGSGTYTVTLIVANMFGCTDTITHSIIVNPNPVSAYTATIACHTYATVFTDNSTAAVKWSWNYGDATALDTTQSPSHIFANPGNYNVALLVTNVFGCTNSSSQTVTVLPQPVADFSFSTVCARQSVQFTDLTTGISLNSWSWNFGDGSALSTTQNPTHIYALGGNYTVTLIVGNIAGCADTIIKPIIVNTVPVPLFSAADGCLGTTTVFTDLSVDSVAISTWLWDFNDGNGSSAQSPNYIYNTPGAYNVSLTVTNINGCDSSIVMPLNIHTFPTAAFTVNTVCAGNTTVYTNTSTGPAQWTWDFGDGTPNDTTQNPVHVYAIPGVYTTTLYAHNAFGCRDSVSVNTTANPVPVAAFTFDTVCANAATSFIDHSTSAVTWQWDFGDGSPLNGGNSQAHIYPAAGTYNVTLITTNLYGCTDTVSHSIIVNPNPVSAYTATNACLGYPTVFTDNSTSPNSWLWNFGDATATDITQSPSHIFASAGTYTVSLQVTNTFGCTNSSTQNIIVLPQPIADFTFGTVCAQQSLQFTDATTGPSITTWSWNFGDGSPVNNTQDPLHVYTLAGNYNVTLIAGNSSGCLDTVVKIITVNTVPTPLFVATSPCQGIATSFTDQSTDAVTINNWHYDFNDGNTSVSQNPNHIYATAGTYNVTLIVTNINGCSDTITSPVNIHVFPAAAFTVSTVCTGNASTFTNTSTGTPAQWTWDFGDATANDTAQNPVHTYTLPGVYTTTLFAQNTFGCRDSVSMNTTVNPVPVAAFTFDTVCANSATSFTDQSTSAVAWQWNFGDGSPLNTGNSQTHIYPAAGSYNVTLITTNLYGCTDTISHSVIVNPNPVSAYTATNACLGYPTAFTDNSTSPVSWSWNFGDASATDITQSPSHIFANAGTYNVSLQVTNTFGCTNSITQPVTVLPQPVADFTNGTLCATQNVQFTDATASSAITTWSWNFGDGSPVTNTQNPLHAYALAGNYNVTLVAGNSSGCLDTIVKTITVNTIPTPLFTATTTCQGTATSFTDQSTDVVAINNWYYDFNDGNNSVSQNPNYIYAAAGTYNVSLTVTNVNGCSDTVTLPVTVNVFPTAIYSADTVCIGTPTTFTDASTGFPTGWQWNFGDGGTSSTGPTTTHIYATAGAYITSLSVSSGAGCTDQSFLVVMVRSDVQADIAAQNAACVGEAVTMNDNSVVTTGFIQSAAWDFGDGTPLAFTLNTIHTYTTAGTYTITHVVTSDGGCASTTIDTIVVNPLPVANFTTANTCQAQPSVFTDNSSGSPVTWDWNFGDGGTSAIQDPTHPYAAAGNYATTLIVNTAAGCADTATRNITVYAQPNASFTSNVVCWGDMTTFQNTSTTTSGTIIGSWWDFGDGATSTLNSLDHTFATQNDTFNVTLAIVTSFGCVDTVTQQAFTHPLPVFNYGPQQTSGCNEFTTAFNENTTVSGGTIVNWLWNFGDGNLTYIQNPVHTYDSAGSYFVSLVVTSSYGCQMGDTLNYPIVVYPHPTAEFSSSPNETSIYEPHIQFNDESIGATLWDWNLGDNETSIEENPYHVYPDTGTYMVTQIAINEFGCRDTVEHPVRINGETSIFIPNAFTPNSNGLNDVFAPKLYGVTEFKMFIFDRWGNQIFKTEDMNEGWNGRVNGVGAEVQQDVYVYKIFTKDLLSNSHSYIGSITVVK